jgi:signal transduction histidine kinase
MDQVEESRHGVRGSIVGRMRRHGGRAEIRSAPGDGTEVRLTLPASREGVTAGKETAR